MKLIKLENEYYLLSDEEILEGDLCYDKKQNKIYKASKVVQNNKIVLEYPIFKIIASTKEIEGIRIMSIVSLEEVIKEHGLQDKTEWEVLTWGHYNTKTFCEIIDIK